MSSLAIRSMCEESSRLIRVAAGQESADLVLKNATYVNVFTNQLDTADIAVCGTRIAGIGTYHADQEVDLSGKIVIPGLIDSHIHLESSLVSPGEFVRAVLPHGTTAVVTDPHEIANVMGTDGIEYMLQATEGLPVTVFFMLPSCVPATPLDESGAVLDQQAIDRFYSHPRVLGLAEMMNFPGVVGTDPHVLEKLAAAQLHGSRVDGHAPGLSGNELNAYIAAGVRSDHECSTTEDAMAKLRRGQYIMIREGTAAKNMDALLPLLVPGSADRCLLCCDDKHPGDLLDMGHIDYLIRKAISRGVDPILAVKAGSFNASQYFGLSDRGAIAPGWQADLAVVDNFENFCVEQVYSGGQLVSSDMQLATFSAPAVEPQLAALAHDTFHVEPLSAESFRLSKPAGVIGLVPGEIISTHAGFADGIDIEQDLLKIAVVERHHGTGHIGIGYIKGYGMKKGAVATSVAHDSHNIIAVGTSDDDLAFAINRVIENRGGIVVSEGAQVVSEVVLSIAGIMSDDTLGNVNEALENAKQAAYALGVSDGLDPFMTLSFMSLPVIPSLRLMTTGMFHVETQQFV